MNKNLDLNTVVARTIWWKKPEQALQNKEQMIAYAMTYGTFDEIAPLINTWGRDAFIKTLKNAPAGVFDLRSWHFWHVYLRQPLKPMPKRFEPC